MENKTFIFNGKIQDVGGHDLKKILMDNIDRYIHLEITRIV